VKIQTGERSALTLTTLPSAYSLERRWVGHFLRNLWTT
jgi:hypothetical protein